MSTAEVVYELLKAMPEDKADIVLEFVRSLQDEMQFHSAKQSRSRWSPDFLSLYGSCADDEFEVDDAGISDAMDDELIGVFDE
jgi:hypothetical protein